MNTALLIALLIVVACGVGFSGLAWWGSSLHRGNWALVGGATGVLIGLGVAMLWLLLAWLMGWGG